MAIPWRWIGRFTVFVLAVTLVFAGVGIAEALAGDGGLRGFYRGVVRMEIIVVLYWLIFVRAR